AGTAQAQQSKPAGNEIIDVIGRVVITAVRPSTLGARPGKEAVVTSHSAAFPKTGRIDVTINMRWHGALTENQYWARFTIKIQVDQTSAEVLGIDYTDNCLFPAPDMRLLNGAIRILNEQL